MSPRSSSVDSMLRRWIGELAVALEVPDPVRNGLLALALGLMLGTGLAFVLERFGGGLSPAEVERDSGVPNLAVVPDFDRGKRVSR